MSNHGHDNNQLPEFLKAELLKTQVKLEDAMRLVFHDREKLGATGRFPLGKLTPEDEGEIQFAVAADPKTKTIILDFGKPVVWLGMPRDDARKLVELILERIKEL